MASAIKKLKVSGKSLLTKEGSEAEGSRFSDLVQVQCKASIQVEYNRDDSRLIEIPNIQQDDVVELEFEGGFKEWVRGNDLAERLDESQVRSHGSVIITPNSLRHTNSSDDERGLIGVVLKFLKVLKIDPIESLVDLSVAALTERFEGKQIAQPGVYQYQQKGLDSLKYCQSDIDVTIDTNKPVLLFIHGTFSTTKGSFGDLWDSGNQAYIDQLLHPYGDQVFFVEHFTVSVSPIHNALMVARLFPTGTRFHIIGHSRGGLVGELLSQGKLKRREDGGNSDSFVDSDVIFTEGELRAFKGEEHRKDDYRDLKQLQQVLQVREIYVERFVRIAAPARGTLLASDNIENMLNAAYNVLNLIPVPQLVGVAEFIKMLLLTLIKQRKKVNVLPGIESMIPNSPLIALLNRHSVQLNNELTVIAGEIEGTGFIGRLKAWVANKIFEEDHDFVVNTAAMYGGCPRVEQASRYHLEKGKGASHFKYFQNVTVRQRIKDALNQPLGELGAFLPFPSHSHQANSGTRDSDNKADKHTSLYFIPGVFGSELSASSKSIWMDIAALQWGDFSELQLNKAGIKAKQLVSGHYEELLDYLSATHKIIPFAYDWRRSHLLAGRKLGEAISQHLDQIEQSGEKHTIRLLAHSTGGLVIKAMMLEYPMIWERLMQTDAQVVMLGTPLAGSYKMVQLLAGQHRLTQLMHMLENPLDEHSTVNQLAQYPGILELLPHNEHKSYFDADIWKNILADDQKENWTGFAGLEAAKEVREQLDDIAIKDWRICYVAGQARLTPSNISIDNGDLRLLASRAGDGFSCWDDNHPAPNKLWFIPIEHGNLVRFSSAYKGILDLLQSGNTQQLSKELPTRSDDEERLPDNIPSLYPDEKEMLAAALCFPTKASKQDMQVSVDVRVINGNLEHVKNAIVVGHYEGDSIVNAEHVIDQRLDGRLRELHRLGMYPGELNTSKVLLNDSKRPSGVIIVGLGDVGKLSTGDLLETYTHALLDFTMLMRDQHQQNQSNHSELISLSITTLLVGSGFGGLQIQESIICILRAIKRANKALRKNHQGRISAITSVEFIELYEDRAIETIKALQKIVAHYEYSEQFALHSYLGSLPGASRRVMFGEQTGWWQRIQIEGDTNGLLRYLTLTNRARAEAELLPTQSKLVDKFVAVATKDSFDDSEIRKTLFELLVPNDLKDHTHDLENLVIILNKHSAGLPWELLQNRLDVGADPISVGAGMLRQLQTEHFREVVINPGKRMALVVGNPKTTHFSDLAAATAEAKDTSKQLIQQGFEVKSEIESSARSILNALHNSDYRVLHLAGHGVFNYDHNREYEKPVTGMVLGDDIYLTPVEIRQMRKVPEFAFINCCHLGKMETDPEEVRKDRHKLAANIAAELIGMGVKAIVAAGWAIKDSAAQCFAEEFYDKLLSGHTFGESVISARKKTFDEYETSNTWGAYQCYGDPDYVLTHHASSDTVEYHHDHQEDYRFVSENEVVVTLQNLSNSADSARVDSFKSLNTRLSHIEQAIPIDWLKKSRIRHALGRAHGKLDNFKEAIEHYKATRSIQLANYPVSMLEDLVSLKTAWALVLDEDGQQKKSLYPNNADMQAEAKESITKAKQHIKEALDTLDLLDQLGLSIERWEERGKAWKRKAMISKGRARSTALREMESAYHKAHEMALIHLRDVSPYPLVNWQTARIVRHLRDKRNKLDKSELIYWLNQARQCALNIDADDHSFCSGITLAECTILSYIIETDLLYKNDIVEQTVDYYSKAIERGAAPRQIRFVSEHLSFLINILENRQNNDEVASIVKVLNKVLEMLDSSLREL